MSVKILPWPSIQIYIVSLAKIVKKISLRHILNESAYVFYAKVACKGVILTTD
jgi:hypothetical protein